MRRKYLGIAVAIMGGVLPGLPLASWADTAKGLPVPAAKVVLLGTAGGPIVRKTRSQPANLIVVNGAKYLVDIGEGTVLQLAKLDVPSSDITAAFITHHHIDHNAGLSSLLEFRWALLMSGTKRQPLALYGPPGTREITDAALRVLSVSAGVFRAETPGAPPVEQTANAADTVPGLVYQDANVRVTAVENSHFSTTRMPETPHGIDRSYSYRIDTPNGSVVFTGDSGPSDALEKLAEGADLLVSEVIDTNRMVAFAKGQSVPPAVAAAMVKHMELEHLSPEAVGRLATRAHVRRVALTHYAMPTEDPNAPNELARQVRRWFNGPVVAGGDLTELSLAPRARVRTR